MFCSCRFITAIVECRIYDVSLNRISQKRIGLFVHAFQNRSVGFLIEMPSEEIRSSPLNRETSESRVRGRPNLKAGAVVGEAADAVEGLVDELLADGVVTAGVVVRRILLPGDQLLRVEQVLVRPRPALV